MKFSIVIPSYNNKELFECAILSVLKQDYNNFEIVVVDDSNNNDICNCVRELCDTRVRYYHNLPPKGAVNNWNYGLSLTHGEAIILLHHDESFINDSYLSKLNLLLQKYDVVVSDKMVITEDGEKKERFPKWYKHIALKFLFPIFIFNVIGPCACVCLKKKCMVDFDNRLHWRVDVDWYYRVIKNAQKMNYYTSKEILSKHGHLDQISKNINIVNEGKKDEIIILSKYHSKKINAMIKLGHFVKKIKDILDNKKIKK